MRYLLLDGFNLAFRAYHAMPELARADGFPIGAIQGWVRILWKLSDQVNPDCATVFFDKDGSRRHLEVHPAYKAGRPETPAALKLQIPEMKTAAAVLGFHVVEQSGVEADDLIASAAIALSGKGHDVRIASADKDFAQLVGEHIHLLTPPPPGHGGEEWRELDAAGVSAKFGVQPAQIVDYLSLIGDTVDNIPGLRGVGPKTASAWLARHGSIAGILAATETLEPARFREILRDGAPTLALNQNLIAFSTDFSGNWFAPPTPVDIPAARAFLTRLALPATLREFDRRHAGVAPAAASEQLELFA